MPFVSKSNKQLLQEIQQDIINMSSVTYTEGTNIDITEDDVIKVEDNPTFTNSVIAGATKIGGIGGSAFVSQSEFTNWEDAALIQWNTGHTIINCSLNKQIYFRNGGVGSRTFAKIDNQGEFHIYRNGLLQKINDVFDETSTNMADGSLSISKTSGLQNALNEKQDKLIFTSGNNVSISQGFSNDGDTVHIEADIDYSQIDTSQLGFDLKQDKLTAGQNITISNNGTISSSFHGYNFELIDSKQDGITSSTDLIARSLVLGNVLTEPAEGEIVTMGNISGATLNATNVSVADSISCSTLNADNISVAPNLNITASIGKAKLGKIADFHQHAGFCHVNQNNTSGYALLQTNDGGTYLNALINKAIYFSISHQTKMILKSNGYVGIGTTNPGVALDVHSPINYHTWGTYFDANNNWYDGPSIHGTQRSHQTRSVSIMGHGILSWGGFFAASDARFKTNIQDIDDSGALDLLRQIKPKTYEYIDKPDRGAGTVYGFIAQDIAEVFPNASSIEREKIPNIYELGIKVENVITLTNKSTALLEKDVDGVIYKTLLVYHKDNKKIELSIKSIIDDKHIEIEPTDELEINSELFIYGQIVDNFHTMDKNYIFTIATAALQEVDKQLQAEKQKNASLEARMLLLEARMNKLDNNGTAI